MVAAMGKFKALAIDQGTTSTRGFVLNDSGNGQIIFSVEHRQIYPQSGWVEHDPEELLNNITKCLNAAPDVTAIGIDNQGESCLAWNGETGEPISPVIVWQDRRTENNIEQLKAEGGEECTMASAGLPLDPYFSASKLAWIMENVPQAKKLFSAGKLRLGTTDAFFIDRLTGNFFTDITTASRTSLMNLKSGEWDPELCKLFGVPIEALPEIRPTMGEFGMVDVNGRSIPLTASAVDQQASLYGHGCRKFGDIKITFGTGAFALSLASEQILDNPQQGLLPTIAWQVSGEAPVYALDGGVYCAGSAINWAKSLGLFQNFSDINQFDAPSAVSRDLVFVPALTGLGCPFWDGSAAGLWLGMSLDTTKADLVQAILEGVALRSGQVISTMAKQLKLKDHISIDGGVANNPYFCQFLADNLQRSIHVQSITELTAFGTAQMALGEDAKSMTGPEPKHIYTPQTGAGDDNYQDRYDDAVSRSRNWRI